MNHEYYMRLAIAEAQKAEASGEVPVGAVITDAAGDILATAHNQTIFKSDPTAHAEIEALRKASAKLQNYRLLSTTLYATVEPCVMCMGAIVHARVQCVVFGAPDPKWGAAGSLYNFSEDTRLNHHPQIIGGVKEEQCRTMIQAFFRSRRE
ncbi:MAG: tRNA adenosine(34) deaminase TadA [Deltaproteobacteria bacterium]